MLARRFHSGEVVESFLSQPLLAGLSATALQRASLLRILTGCGLASTSHPGQLTWSICACSSPWGDCSTTCWNDSHQYPQSHRQLRASTVACSFRPVGQQEGRCNGCCSGFPFLVLEVDHIMPRGGDGQDNIEDLQLLCAHCNRIKGDRPHRHLVARLPELRVIA